MRQILFSVKMLKSEHSELFYCPNGQITSVPQNQTISQQSLVWLSSSSFRWYINSLHSHLTSFFLLQPGTSGALQTPRSFQKACMPLLWCWVSHALPTSCQPTRASAHCRSLWDAQSKTSSSSWSSSSWCLWPSWLACSTCTHTTLEPSTILPSPRELCLAVRVLWEWQMWLGG